MTDILELARKSGLDIEDRGDYLSIVGAYFALATFTEAVRQEERERAAERVKSLDCAHRCGIGAEIAAAILAQPEQKR